MHGETVIWKADGYFIGEANFYTNSDLSCQSWRAVFSLDPRTSDLEYEITDLIVVNLFAPLPLAVSVPPGT